MHYVMYAEPEDMIMIISWLYDQALEMEELKRQEKAMYQKPKAAKTKSSGKDELLSYEEETSFGVPKKGAKGKPPQPKAEPPKPRKKKTDAEGNEVKEEKKETKANRIKDVDVTVNEDEV